MSEPSRRFRVLLPAALFGVALLASFVILTYEARTSCETYRYVVPFRISLVCMTWVLWSAMKVDAGLRWRVLVITSLCALPFWPGLGGPGQTSLVAQCLGGRRLPLLLGEVGDAWARNLKPGALFFSTEIDVSGDLSDKGAESLAQVTSLQRVRLEGSWNLTNTGLQDIASLPQLLSLELGYGTLDEDKAKTVARMPKLHSLTLVNMELDDEALRALASAPSLRLVTLAGSGGTCERGVRSLQNQSILVTVLDEASY